MWLIIAAVPTVTLAQYGSNLSVTGSIDATWQSKYVWRGFNIFGETSAMQYTGDIQVNGTGVGTFGATLQAHIANGGAHVNAQRWDYNPYYQNVAFAGEPYMLAYRVGYVWYNYPRLSSKIGDLQELHGVLSLPKVTGIEGLVPSYVAVKLWQAKSSSQTTVGNANGWAHIFMLDYNIDLPGLVPESPKQPLHLHSELVYNAGVDPRPGGPGVDSDWSDFVVGASTDFDLGYNISITPSVNYQISMENDVNRDDELWVTLGAKIKF
jgi:hypothetical protein